jgi:hypothetical protein
MSLSLSLSHTHTPSAGTVSYRYPLYRGWHNVFPDQLVEALM